MDTLLRSRDPIEARKAIARIGQAPKFQEFLALRPVEYRGSTYQNFFGLKFGPACRLSIQANNGAYCEPRETGLPVADYVRWEFAICVDDNPMEPVPGFLIPFTREYDGVETRSGFASMPEFEDCWGGDEVAAYVPTEMVQAVFQRLWVEFGTPSIF